VIATAHSLTLCCSFCWVWT